MTENHVVAGYPRRHPDSAFRKIGEEGGLVVLPGNSEVKVMNPVGIAVFALLDGSRDVDGLASAVAEEFEIDLPQAREDVLAFIEDLGRAGMLADAAGVPAERPM